MKKTYLIIPAVLVLSGVLSACDDKTPKLASSPESVATDGSDVKQKVEKAADKAGQAIDDSAITAKAKLALADAPELKSMNISVETVQGRVTLSGKVGSDADAKRAASVVSSLEGVTGVENRLEINPPG